MSKRHLGMILLLLIVGSLFASTLFAEPGFDDQGNPNNPAVNERANACFEGGTQEFRCHSDTDWVVGWYLIRLEFGLLSRADVPGWIFPPEAILPTPIPGTPVPPTPEPPTPEPPSTCAFTWSPNFYVDFSGGNFVGSGNYWSDPDCTVPNGNLSRKWVFSPSGLANATSICVANLDANYFAIPSHGPFVFECVL